MTKRTKKRRKNKKKKHEYIIIAIISIALFTIFSTITFKYYFPKYKLNKLSNIDVPDWIDVQIIPLDGISRDGSKLDGYNDIVVHYVGNPNTTAQQNHDYYCNPDSEVSSHFIVGLEGEIIQCIPLDEQSAASNWRNHDTISIEVCHPDESGKFNDKTYISLVKLVDWLKAIGYLNTNHIIRHHDITGKICPMYYVEHEDAWLQFKKDVKAYH